MNHTLLHGHKRRLSTVTHPQHDVEVADLKRRHVLLRSGYSVMQPIECQSSKMDIDSCGESHPLLSLFDWLS